MATSEPLRHVASARRRVTDSERALRVAIHAAFHGRQGYTVDDIAESAGLTRQRVYQIVRELDQERSA
jgi:predicted transcriptional regulator